MMARKLRVRCAECGGVMSHYRTDGINVHVVSVHRCSCCDPTADSPDQVVVRLENQVAELRKMVEAATVLLKEACDSIDKAVNKSSDGRWYLRHTPTFLTLDWQMRAIIFQANSWGKHHD